MLPPRPFDATIKRALVSGRVCDHQHEAEDNHQQGADSNAGKERPQHQVFPNRQGVRTQDLTDNQITLCETNVMTTSNDALVS